MRPSPVAEGRRFPLQGSSCSTTAGSFNSRSTWVSLDDRQLAQAHAGTYQLESGKLRLVAEVGVVIDPTSREPD